MHPSRSRCKRHRALFSTSIRLCFSHALSPASSSAQPLGRDLLIDSHQASSEVSKLYKSNPGLWPAPRQNLQPLQAQLVFISTGAYSAITLNNIVLRVPDFVEFGTFEVSHAVRLGLQLMFRCRASFSFSFLELHTGLRQHGHSSLLSSPSFPPSPRYIYILPSHSFIL